MRKILNVFFAALLFASPALAQPVPGANTRPNVTNATGTLPGSSFPGLLPCTAGLTFGGSATGVTFGTNVCSYSLFGKWELIQISMILTSKGAQTGTALVTGLPVATKSDASAYQTCAFVFATGSLTGDARVLVGPNSQAIQTYQITGGVAAALTDAAFSNTTNLYINCLLATN